MAWEASWANPLAAYLISSDALIGDRRTGFTFRETLKGIIASGSLICQRIAAHSQRQSSTDRGFDDVAAWRTIWGQQEHVACHFQHTDRLRDYQAVQGEWQAGDLTAARVVLRPYATVQTERVVTRGRPPRPKAQLITAQIRACPLRLTYDANVRHEGDAELWPQALWLVEVQLMGVRMQPWLMLTDWPVTDADSALRIFCMYRQRWGWKMLSSSRKSASAGRTSSYWT